MRPVLVPKSPLIALALASCVSNGPRPVYLGPAPELQAQASPGADTSVQAFALGPISREGVVAGSPAPQGDAGPWSTFGVEVGSVSSAINSTVRVGLAGAGVGLDLEELLGLDRSNTTLQAKAYWRFSENERHRVDLSWLDLNRRGTKAIAQDVDLGNGEVITAGTTTTTRLDLRLLKAQYSYSLFQDERVDIGVGGSLYVLPIDFQLEAAGVSDSADSFGVTAPLPAVGLRFDFAVTPHWLLQSDLNLFYIEFDDYKGALTSWSGGLEYRPWDHFALGLGLESFALGVEQNGKTDIPGVNEAGSIDLGYLGLGLSLKTRW